MMGLRITNGHPENNRRPSHEGCRSSSQSAPYELEGPALPASGPARGLVVANNVTCTAFNGYLQDGLPARYVSKLMTRGVYLIA